MTAELYGLVLTGGHSRRMQRDKASLEYDGKTQLTRAIALLAPFVVRSFVSVRADQLRDPHRAAYDTIADVIGDLGPLGGIHAAQQKFPHAAWLVLACDLPFLDASTLQRLIAARAAARSATAFRSDFDGQPEPLCTIFEPASRSAIEAWVAAKHKCPRAFLAQSDVKLIELDHRRALDNVNTADEYSAAKAALSPVTRAADAATLACGAARRLKVQYFAVLREQAGRSDEELETQAGTPRELYDELRRRRGLTLAPEFLRVAVNEDFGEWTQPLADGDTVVFLPPVAGG